MRLEQLGEQAKRIIDGERLLVVTDENVAPLYLERCFQSLSEAGFAADSFVIPPGEESKSGEMYLRLINHLAQIPLTRADGLVALGGGVVGDLTGFAAATYLRGIKVIQVPTTLLAAVDSSIGGKTAINLNAGKNLAGAFHQPALILRDAELLKSLPAQVYQDGMAEVIKYGVLADRDLLALLCEKNAARENMDEIIQRCADLKQRYVDEDEHDVGVRQLLNLGHTVGHAIEKATAYEVSHGSAVAKGMAKIAEISAKQGWCSQACCDKIVSVLTLYDFDLTIDQDNRELYEIMRTDKKRKGGHIDIVVPEEIGRCRLQRLTIEEMGEILCEQ